MPPNDRRVLLQRLSELRQAPVLAYVTSDRNPVGGQIGEDAVRLLHQHLRALGTTSHLDVVIYSRGGALDVPWRLATALRTAAEQWRLLVPFRANSAATLLALGADELVFGRHGELGPIDPIMNLQRREEGTAVQDTVNVEDVMAYVRFVQDRVGLTDQVTLAASLEKLTDRLDAIGLGSAYRTHSHIRDVARRMILSRHEPPNERTVEAIVETLAERVYAHGHAIGAVEAQELGLPVTRAEGELDDILWELLNQYERDMKLLEPIDPRQVIEGRAHYSEDVTVAIIDSESMSHEFRGDFEVTAKRQMPQQFQVNLNLNVQLPQGLDPANLVPELQQALQQTLNQGQQALIPHAQRAVEESLKAQAPLVGVEFGLRGGRWRLIDGEADS